MKKPGFAFDAWASEDITVANFMKLVNYAYCGFFGADDLDDRDQTSAEHAEDSMVRLTTASRLGFSIFTDKYELRLFSLVKKHTENVYVLKEFANTYNFRRLELRCDQILQMQSN